MESTTYRGSISLSEPQRPFASRGSEDPAGREPPIADECGRHSSLPMDWAGTTSGTVAKPTGWYPDCPVFPPAQRILIVASSRGKQTPAAARQRWAHSAAQSRPSPVHRWRHQRPFLSKSKRARNHPSGGPERAGRIRFSLAPPKGNIFPSRAPPLGGASKNVCIRCAQGLPCGGSWHAQTSISRASGGTGNGLGMGGFVPPCGPQH